MAEKQKRSEESGGEQDCKKRDSERGVGNDDGVSRIKWKTVIIEGVVCCSMLCPNSHKAHLMHVRYPAFLCLVLCWS